MYVTEVVAFCDRLKNEKGILDMAGKESIIAGYKELTDTIAQLERKLTQHDQQIVSIIQAIKTLASPTPVPKKRRIGFNPED